MICAGIDAAGSVASKASPRSGYQFAGSRWTEKSFSLNFLKRARTSLSGISTGSSSRTIESVLVSWMVVYASPTDVSGIAQPTASTAATTPKAPPFKANRFISIPPHGDARHAARASTRAAERNVVPTTAACKDSDIRPDRERFVNGRPRSARAASPSNPRLSHAVPIAGMRPERSGRRFRDRRGPGAVIGEDAGVDAAADVEVALDPQPLGRHRGDQVVEDLLGDRLVEGADVAEAPEVELQRLELNALLVGDVAKLDGREVGLAGLRADAAELGAVDRDEEVPARAGTGEGLEVARRAGGHPALSGSLR